MAQRHRPGAIRPSARMSIIKHFRDQVERLAASESPLFKAKRGDKKTSTRALRLAHDAATDISITATRENKMNECNANASRRAEPS